jgi:exoribonuclease II
MQKAEIMIEQGTIVEYIDRQAIVCAMVLEDSGERVRLLNEHNRELSHKVVRLSHISRQRLKIAAGRDRHIQSLKEAAARRRALSETIDIPELWDVLSESEEWIDLPTMTGLCFPDQDSGDHESAVIRAVFANRVYFKFGQNAFLPYTEDQVARNIASEQEKAKRHQMIETASLWLRRILETERPEAPGPEAERYIEILKSYYLFGKESDDFLSGRAILSGAGIDNTEKIFDALVKVGVWSPHQHIELYRYDIPVEFSQEFLKRAEDLNVGVNAAQLGQNREDLTSLPLFTIDGMGTLDFDDAISIEPDNGYYWVGVHIADISAYIRRGDSLDEEIMTRATSIYMPDMKIPMLPPLLSENLCSLKAGEIRPAISILAKIGRRAEIYDYKIVPSMIRVNQQLTYGYVDTVADSDQDFAQLIDIAKNFRNRRLESGAMPIALPEIGVRVTENGEISVRRNDRESQSRLLVSEMMILANWLMARFLANHNMPAVFRSQPEPKARLYNQANEGTLFQTWMQRRMLHRVILSSKPEFHTGLGLDAYITGTSPIRKFFDMVTQRQIRACLDLDTSYTVEEIDRIIAATEQPMYYAMQVQNRRHRYWLLKYLEARVGQKEEAVVLERRRDGYVLLLTEYLLECKLSQSASWHLKPQDLVQVTIQHVDARRDVLTVFPG